MLPEWASDGDICSLAHKYHTPHTCSCTHTRSHTHTDLQRMGSLHCFLNPTVQQYCLYILNHCLTKWGGSSNWTLWAEHKHAEDESPVCTEGKRKKCLLPNAREKFLQEAKIKDSLKQKQDESLSFWKDHSETMVLNEIQFLTKIFSVLQGLLWCCVYQELCFIFPKRVGVTWFYARCLSLPHLATCWDLSRLL